MSYLEKALAAEAAARAVADHDLQTQITAANYTAPYRTIKDFGVFRLTGLTAGTYLLLPANGAAGVPGSAVAAATDGSADAAFYFDPAYHALTGRTTNSRLRVQLLANATAPNSTFTTSIQLAGALSGANAARIAVGSAPSPVMSVAQTPSGANSKTTNGSGDVANSAWAATYYVLQLVVSGSNMAAGAYVTLMAQIEVHNT